MTASTSAVIDMHLPETFHRLKRTVMMLCGSMIVLSIATSAPGEISLPLFRITLPIDQLCWLMWGAAAYYLIGFVMEARVARLINSEAINNEGMENLDKALGHIGLRFQGHEKDMEQQVKAAAANAHLLQDPKASVLTIDIVRSEIAKQIDATSDQPARYDAAIGMSVARLDEKLQRQATWVEDASHALSEMQKAVAALEDTRQALAERIDALQENLSTLSRRISGDRRASFWVWEIGGAVAIFVAATTLNLVTLATGAAAFALWTISLW